jgi:hypothetical protein
VCVVACAVTRAHTYSDIILLCSALQPLRNHNPLHLGRGVEATAAAARYNLYNECTDHWFTVNIGAGHNPLQRLQLAGTEIQRSNK